MGEEWIRVRVPRELVMNLPGVTPVDGGLMMTAPQLCGPRPMLKLELCGHDLGAWEVVGLELSRSYAGETYYVAELARGLG